MKLKMVKISVVWIVGVGVGAISMLIMLTSAQLDLPSMPGPPYPDPRGQNRWGVKFDPRKHGPPYDKRGSNQRNVWHRGPPAQGGGSGGGRLKVNGRDRDHEKRPNRERDAYWSPAKMRRHSRPPKRPRRQNRFYDNNLKRRRPRTHMSAYKSKENNWKWPDESHESKNHNSNPSKEDRQKFWKSWNAWYKKQIDVREQMKKGKAIKQSFPHSSQDDSDEQVYYIDAEEFEKLRLAEEDGEHLHRPHNAIHGGQTYSSRVVDFYRTKMRDMMKRAKSLTSFVVEDENEERQNTQDTDSDGEKPEGWRIFTTIGKGIDAANEAMGSVRKTVGGSVLGTGIKYGGKIAMDAVMNVGTSALTTAIKSATLG